MKFNLFFKSVLVFGILTILLLFSAINVTAQTLLPKEIEFLQNQTSVIAQETERYFDVGKPGYHSTERKNVLYLIDAITHSPKPHNDAIKELFLNRYTKSLESIKSIKVDSGLVIWNVYNMSYIVKTKSVTAAFDLVLLPDCMMKEGEIEMHKKMLTEIVKLCDVLFVSHNHGDHFDNYVAQVFLSQNKPVIAQKEIFKNQDFYDKITHLENDGRKVEHLIPGVNKTVEIRIFPGHQAIAVDKAIDNNLTVLTLPEKITVAHSGDQSWEADFSWLDTMKNVVNIDLLMINTWTLSPDRVVEGLNPKVILPGHVNEMDHTIIGRVPYWKSYEFWENNEEKTVHLFWGEPYFYNK